MTSTNQASGPTADEITQYREMLQQMQPVQRAAYLSRTQAGTGAVVTSTQPVVPVGASLADGPGGAEGAETVEQARDRIGAARDLPQHITGLLTGSPEQMERDADLLASFGIDGSTPLNASMLPFDPTQMAGVNQAAPDDREAIAAEIWGDRW